MGTVEYDLTAVLARIEGKIDVALSGNSELAVKHAVLEARLDERAKMQDKQAQLVRWALALAASSFLGVAGILAEIVTRSH